ncbi:MAG TPA: UDP-glucose 4-epimerase GalE [Actinomycetes bacterium]|nr:UDP-glucose 4-epimerase GalE [Actinomycetes bacterium]
MTWMVTGGAGYIGAHIVASLREAGFGVVALDDLSTGERRKVPDDVPLVEASVVDGAAVEKAIREYDVTGVVHMAAKKAVGESVERPLYYYRENVDGLLSLLEAMDATGLKKMVYSSSAATFGMPDSDEPLTEDYVCQPINPYGETKLIGEWLMKDVAAALGLDWISLRYFNVAGAGGPDLGDTGVFNLIPMVFRALSTGKNPQVFGSDYPTPDGSCIRDYIHVTDLAEAHVAAVQRLEQGKASEIYNVGRGKGVSVIEVMDAVRAATGIDFTHDLVGRRAGDPARLVASADKIKRELGWTARYDLADMVSSAWEAWQAHPPA